ncbi:hypothetical protein [Streptomyces varsoviensis]|uniref:Uncharacterized protein n=1 Tax=Streptomyces varsoviensis TaxID=67373 RepID=A0ABR5J4X6_9ACTN|nr:hypothetical protein [Streptomyces varsoviensis]KOG88474.1 hypothetical protein ADK38_19590 [Streptomyces varsoviensis]
MSAQEPAAPVAARRDEERQPSMSDLLASCAAASAVSTPPTAPEAAGPRTDEGSAPAGTDCPAEAGPHAA